MSGDIQIFLRTIGFLCVAGLAACSQNERELGGSADMQRLRQSVETADIRFESYNQVIEAIGTSRARQTAMIRPESDGRIEAILVQSTDAVEAGQVLARLEGAEEVLAVKAAEIELERQRLLLERYQRLDGSGAVSETQIDEAQIALSMALTSLEAARLALFERSILAPFSGRVGLLDQDVGTRVTPSSNFVRIDDRTALFVDFRLPENLYGILSPGNEVELSPFHRPSTSLTASIFAIDSDIDPAERTFRVRAVLDNPKDEMRPGMSFRISLTVEQSEYPILPEAAVLWGSRGAYAWRLVEGVAHRTPVTILFRSNGDVFVDAVFEPGDVIVSSGVQKVREGQTIILTHNGDG